MSSLPRQDGDAPDATAPAVVNEDELLTLLARLMPNIERLLISRPRTPSLSVENASSTTAPAPAVTPANPALTPAPSVSSSRQPAVLMDTLGDLISLDVSDPAVELGSLQRDLSAAHSYPDTFDLGHLSDSAPLPTYDSTVEPDYVPSTRMPHAGPPTAHPSPARSSPSSRSPYAGQTVPPSSRSPYAGQTVPLATPARPWGPLHPPSGLPRRQPASAPLEVPGTHWELPPYNPFPAFQPSANLVHFRAPGDSVPSELHGLGAPFYPLLGRPRAPMFSPSSREILVDSDLNWVHRDFFPSPFRLDDVSSRVPPSQVPAYCAPGRPAAFGPPSTIVWPDPGVPTLTANFRLPTGVSVSCQYTTYVEGFPHPYSRGSFHPTDKSQQRSGSRYYVVFYGHEVGIFKSWGGVGYEHVTIPAPSTWQ